MQLSNCLYFEQGRFDCINMYYSCTASFHLVDLDTNYRCWCDSWAGLGVILQEVRKESVGSKNNILQQEKCKRMGIKKGGPGSQKKQTLLAFL